MIVKLQIDQSGFWKLTVERIEHTKYEFDPCPEGLVSYKFPKNDGNFQKVRCFKGYKA